MTPLLAQRARSGDRAFERIYRRHAPDVYRYSLAVLRNAADAEDVTQTTFLNAYRAFSNGERPREPRNWLIAIAHNVCRQRFRQAQRRVEEVEYDDALGDGTFEDADRPSAEDIRRALGHLAFNQRAALVMRELEGRSYAEIAEILDVSVSAVETLLFRARRALREQLEGSLTCSEAEIAVSRQLDGRLARSEKARLRGHLRECAECASMARRFRAQRTAVRALGLVPLPTSLASFFGGAAAGGAAAGAGVSIGAGLAAKAAAGVAAGALVAGGGYTAVQQARAPEPTRAAPATVTRASQEPRETEIVAQSHEVPARPIPRRQADQRPERKLVAQSHKREKRAEAPRDLPPRKALPARAKRDAAATRVAAARPARAEGARAKPKRAVPAAARQQPKQAKQVKPATQAKPAKREKPARAAERRPVQPAAEARPERDPGPPAERPANGRSKDR